MRPIRNPRKFTPLGIFMHQYCKPSQDGLMVMNEDYILYDWSLNTVMIIEEKCGTEDITPGQRSVLTRLDDVYRHGAKPAGLTYWGIFVVRFPAGCTHVGPGIKLNSIVVSVEELVRHLSFERSIVPAYNPRLEAQQSFDGEVRKQMRKEASNGHS